MKLRTFQHSFLLPFLFLHGTFIGRFFTVFRVGQFLQTRQRDYTDLMNSFSMRSCQACLIVSATPTLVTPALTRTSVHPLLPRMFRTIISMCRAPIITMTLSSPCVFGK